MPRPEPVRDPVRDGRTVTLPTRDDRGGHLGGARLERAPNRTIVRQTIENTTIINNIRVRVNMGPQLPRGHYHWYYDGGIRYTHHYDNWGAHWFGFYLGDAYFWARWHSDRLWWHDHHRARWLYYRDGFWWWQDPANVTIVYIYRDGDYARYTPIRGGYQTRPEQPAPDPAQPPAPGAQTSYYSEDGSRLVELFGERREAFLYDSSGEEPAYLAYLAAGVEEVQFSTETAESPLQILVITRDEQGNKSFRLFDENGAPFGAPQDSVDPEKQLEGSESFGELGAESKTW